VLNGAIHMTKQAGAATAPSADVRKAG